MPLTVKHPQKDTLTRTAMLIKAAAILEAQKDKLTGIDMLIKAAALVEAQDLHSHTLMDIAKEAIILDEDHLLQNTGSKCTVT